MQLLKSEPPVYYTVLSPKQDERPLYSSMTMSKRDGFVREESPSGRVDITSGSGRKVGQALSTTDAFDSIQATWKDVQEQADALSHLFGGRPVYVIQNDEGQFKYSLDGKTALADDKEARTLYETIRDAALGKTSARVGTVAYGEVLRSMSSEELSAAKENLSQSLTQLQQLQTLFTEYKSTLKEEGSESDAVAALKERIEAVDLSPLGATLELVTYEDGSANIFVSFADSSDRTLDVFVQNVEDQLKHFDEAFRGVATIQPQSVENASVQLAGDIAGLSGDDDATAEDILAATAQHMKDKRDEYESLLSKEFIKLKNVGFTGYSELGPVVQKAMEAFVDRAEKIGITGENPQDIDTDIQAWVAENFVEIVDALVQSNALREPVLNAMADATGITIQVFTAHDSKPHFRYGAGETEKAVFFDTSTMEYTPAKQETRFSPKSGETTAGPVTRALLAVRAQSTLDSIDASQRALSESTDPLKEDLNLSAITSRRVDPLIRSMAQAGYKLMVLADGQKKLVQDTKEARTLVDTYVEAVRSGNRASAEVVLEALLAKHDLESVRFHAQHEDSKLEAGKAAQLRKLSAQFQKASPWIAPSTIGFQDLSEAPVVVDTQSAHLYHAKTSVRESNEEAIRDIISALKLAKELHVSFDRFRLTSTQQLNPKEVSVVVERGLMDFGRLSLAELQSKISQFKKQIDSIERPFRKSIKRAKSPEKKAEQKALMEYATSELKHERKPYLDALEKYKTVEAQLKDAVRSLKTRMRPTIDTTGVFGVEDPQAALDRVDNDLFNAALESAMSAMEANTKHLEQELKAEPVLADPLIKDIGFKSLAEAGLFTGELSEKETSVLQQLHQELEKFGLISRALGDNGRVVFVYTHNQDPVNDAQTNRFIAQLATNLNLSSAQTDALKTFLSEHNPQNVNNPDYRSVLTSETPRTAAEITGDLPGVKEHLVAIEVIKVDDETGSVVFLEDPKVLAEDDSFWVEGQLEEFESESGEKLTKQQIATIMTNLTKAYEAYKAQVVEDALIENGIIEVNKEGDSREVSVLRDPFWGGTGLFSSEKSGFDILEKLPFLSEEDADAVVEKLGEMRIHQATQSGIKALAELREFAAKNGLHVVLKEQRDGAPVFELRHPFLSVEDVLTKRLGGAKAPARLEELEILLSKASKSVKESEFLTRNALYMFQISKTVVPPMADVVTVPDIEVLTKEQIQYAQGIANLSHTAVILKQTSGSAVKVFIPYVEEPLDFSSFDNAVSKLMERTKSVYISSQNEEGEYKTDKYTPGHLYGHYVEEGIDLDSVEGVSPVLPLSSLTTGLYIAGTIAAGLALGAGLGMMAVRRQGTLAENYEKYQDWKENGTSSKFVDPGSGAAFYRAEFECEAEVPPPSFTSFAAHSPMGARPMTVASSPSTALPSSDAKLLQTIAAAGFIAGSLTRNKGLMSLSALGFIASFLVPTGAEEVSGSPEMTVFNSTMPAGRRLAASELSLHKFTEQITKAALNSGSDTSLNDVIEGWKYVISAVEDQGYPQPAVSTIDLATATKAEINAYVESLSEAALSAWQTEMSEAERSTVIATVNNNYREGVRRLEYLYEIDADPPTERLSSCVFDIAKINQTETVIRTALLMHGYTKSQFLAQNVTGAYGVVDLGYAAIKANSDIDYVDPSLESFTVGGTEYPQCVDISTRPSDDTSSGGGTGGSGGDDNVNDTPVGSFGTIVPTLPFLDAATKGNSAVKAGLEYDGTTDTSDVAMQRLLEATGAALNTNIERLDILDPVVQALFGFNLTTVANSTYPGISADEISGFVTQAAVIAQAKQLAPQVMEKRAPSAVIPDFSTVVSESVVEGNTTSTIDGTVLAKIEAARTWFSDAETQRGLDVAKAVMTEYYKAVDHTSEHLPGAPLLFNATSDVSYDAATQRVDNVLEASRILSANPGLVSQIEDPVLKADIETLFPDGLYGTVTTDARYTDSLIRVADSLSELRTADSAHQAYLAAATAPLETVKADLAAVLNVTSDVVATDYTESNRADLFRLTWSVKGIFDRLIGFDPSTIGSEFDAVRATGTPSWAQLTAAKNASSLARLDLDGVRQTVDTMVENANVGRAFSLRAQHLETQHPGYLAVFLDSFMYADLASAFENTGVSFSRFNGSTDVIVPGSDAVTSAGHKSSLQTLALNSDRIETLLTTAEAVINAVNALDYIPRSGTVPGSETLISTDAINAALQFKSFPATFTLEELQRYTDELQSYDKGSLVIAGQRLSDHDVTLTDHAARLTSVEGDISGLTTRLNGTDTRLGLTEADVADVREDLDTHITDIDRRAGTLETRVGDVELDVRTGANVTASQFASVDGILSSHSRSIQSLQTSVNTSDIRAIQRHAATVDAATFNAYKLPGVLRHELVMSATTMSDLPGDNATQVLQSLDRIRVLASQGVTVVDQLYRADQANPGYLRLLLGDDVAESIETATGLRLGTYGYETPTGPEVGTVRPDFISGYITVFELLDTIEPAQAQAKEFAEIAAAYPSVPLGDDNAPLPSTGISNATYTAWGEMLRHPERFQFGTFMDTYGTEIRTFTSDVSARIYSELHGTTQQATDTAAAVVDVSGEVDVLESRADITDGRLDTLEATTAGASLAQAQTALLRTWFPGQSASTFFNSSSAFNETLIAEKTAELTDLKSLIGQVSEEAYAAVTAPLGEPLETLRGVTSFDALLRLNISASIQQAKAADHLISQGKDIRADIINTDKDTTGMLRLVLDSSPLVTELQATGYTLGYFQGNGTGIISGTDSGLPLGSQVSFVTLAQNSATISRAIVQASRLDSIISIHKGLTRTDGVLDAAISEENYATVAAFIENPSSDPRDISEILGLESAYEDAKSPTLTTQQERIAAMGGRLDGVEEVQGEAGLVGTRTALLANRLLEGKDAPSFFNGTASRNETLIQRTKDQLATLSGLIEGIPEDLIDGFAYGAGANISAIKAASTFEELLGLDLPNTIVKVDAFKRYLTYGFDLAKNLENFDRDYPGLARLVLTEEDLSAVEKAVGYTFGSRGVNGTYTGGADGVMDGEHVRAQYHIGQRSSTIQTGYAKAKELQEILQTHDRIVTSGSGEPIGTIVSKATYDHVQQLIDNPDSVRDVTGLIESVYSTYKIADNGLVMDHDGRIAALETATQSAHVTVAQEELAATLNATVADVFDAPVADSDYRTLQVVLSKMSKLVDFMNDFDKASYDQYKFEGAPSWEELNSQQYTILKSVRLSKAEATFEWMNKMVAAGSAMFEDIRSFEDQFPGFASLYLPAEVQAASEALSLSFSVFSGNVSSVITGDELPLSEKPNLEFLTLAQSATATAEALENARTAHEMAAVFPTIPEAAGTGDGITGITPEAYTALREFYQNPSRAGNHAAILEHKDAVLGYVYTSVSGISDTIDTILAEIQEVSRLAEGNQANITALEACILGNSTVACDGNPSLVRLLDQINIRYETLGSQIRTALALSSNITNLESNMRLTKDYLRYMRAVQLTFKGGKYTRAQFNALAAELPGFSSASRRLQEALASGNSAAARQLAEEVRNETATFVEEFPESEVEELSRAAELYVEKRLETEGNTYNIGTLNLGGIIGGGAVLASLALVGLRFRQVRLQREKDASEISQSISDVNTAYRSTAKSLSERGIVLSMHEPTRRLEVPFESLGIEHIARKVSHDRIEILLPRGLSVPGWKEMKALTVQETTRTMLVPKLNGTVYEQEVPVSVHIISSKGKISKENVQKAIVETADLYFKKVLLSPGDYPFFTAADQRLYDRFPLAARPLVSHTGPKALKEAKYAALWKAFEEPVDEPSTIGAPKDDRPSRLRVGGTQAFTSSSGDEKEGAGEVKPEPQPQALALDTEARTSSTRREVRIPIRRAQSRHRGFVRSCMLGTGSAQVSDSSSSGTVATQGSVEVLSRLVPGRERPISRADVIENDPFQVSKDGKAMRIQLPGYVDLDDLLDDLAAARNDGQPIKYEIVPLQGPMQLFPPEGDAASRYTPTRTPSRHLGDSVIEVANTAGAIRLSRPGSDSDSDSDSDVESGRLPKAFKSLRLNRSKHALLSAQNFAMSTEGEAHQGVVYTVRAPKTPQESIVVRRIMTRLYEAFRFHGGGQPSVTVLDALRITTSDGFSRPKHPVVQYDVVNEFQEAPTARDTLDMARLDALNRAARQPHGDINEGWIGLVEAYGESGDTPQPVKDQVATTLLLLRTRTERASRTSSAASSERSPRVDAPSRGPVVLGSVGEIIGWLRAKLADRALPTRLPEGTVVKPEWADQIASLEITDPFDIATNRALELILVGIPGADSPLESAIRDKKEGQILPSIFRTLIATAEASGTQVFVDFQAYLDAHREDPSAVYSEQNFYGLMPDHLADIEIAGAGVGSDPAETRNMLAAFKAYVTVMKKYKREPLYGLNVFHHQLAIADEKISQLEVALSTSPGERSHGSRSYASSLSTPSDVVQTSAYPNLDAFIQDAEGKDASDFVPGHFTEITRTVIDGIMAGSIRTVEVAQKVRHALTIMQTVLSEDIPMRLALTRKIAEINDAFPTTADDSVSSPRASVSTVPVDTLFSAAPFENIEAALDEVKDSSLDETVLGSHTLRPTDSFQIPKLDESKFENITAENIVSFPIPESATEKKPLRLLLRLIMKAHEEGNAKRRFAAAKLRRMAPPRPDGPPTGPQRRFSVDSHPPTTTSTVHDERVVQDDSSIRRASSEGRVPVLRPLAQPSRVRANTYTQGTTSPVVTPFTRLVDYLNDGSGDELTPEDLRDVTVAHIRGANLSDLNIRKTITAISELERGDNGAINALIDAASERVTPTRRMSGTESVAAASAPLVPPPLTQFETLNALGSYVRSGQALLSGQLTNITVDVISDATYEVSEGNNVYAALRAISVLTRTDNAEENAKIDAAIARLSRDTTEPSDEAEVDEEGDDHSSDDEDTLGGGGGHGRVPPRSDSRSSHRSSHSSRSRDSHTSQGGTSSTGGRSHTPAPRTTEQAAPLSYSDSEESDSDNGRPTSRSRVLTGVLTPSSAVEEAYRAAAKSPTISLSRKSSIGSKVSAQHEGDSSDEKEVPTHLASLTAGAKTALGIRSSAFPQGMPLVRSVTAAELGSKPPSHAQGQLKTPTARRTVDRSAVAELLHPPTHAPAKAWLTPSRGKGRNPAAEITPLGGRQASRDQLHASVTPGGIGFGTHRSDTSAVSDDAT
jgi:hypothetical protein